MLLVRLQVNSRLLAKSWRSQKLPIDCCLHRELAPLIPTLCKGQLYVIPPMWLIQPEPIRSWSYQITVDWHKLQALKNSSLHRIFSQPQWDKHATISETHYTEIYWRGWGRGVGDNPDPSKFRLFALQAASAGSGTTFPGSWTCPDHSHSCGYKQESFFVERLSVPGGRHSPITIGKLSARVSVR